MNRLSITFFAVLVISTLSLPAQTNERSLLQTCEAQITAQFKQWRFAPVTAEVAEFAKSRHENPTIALGDFDGDGRTDAALLITDGSAAEFDNPRWLNSLHIAVCLDQKTRVKLYLIDKPYCGDGIARAPKGKSYYDFETEKEGVYSLDGVSAYSLGKAGATYEFENGAFRRIVDSD